MFLPKFLHGVRLVINKKKLIILLHQDLKKHTQV